MDSTGPSPPIPEARPVGRPRGGGPLAARLRFFGRRRPDGQIPALRRREWRSSLWIPCALLAGAGFALSPEAGLASGVVALVLLFLLSPARERGAGVLLSVLGVGVWVTARSLYPGLGLLAAGLYLFTRSRWGPDAHLRGKDSGPGPSRSLSIFRKAARGPSAGGGAAAPRTPPPSARPPRASRRPPGPGSGLLANRTLYELVTALGAVALVVALLQQGTATWPAMVAVESCSMEPNVRVGDLVLVVGPSRSAVVTQEGDRVEFREPGLEPAVILPPSRAAGGGGASGGEGPGPALSPATSPPTSSPGSPPFPAGAPRPPPSPPDHRAFALAPGCVAERPDGAGCGARGEPLAGDVIVFYPNGNAACTPIIHRARAWIPDNASYGGRAFARGGFITKGDNNGPAAGDDPSRAADQVARGGSAACRNTEPVQPEWMVGVAKFRVPWLGYVRLLLNPLNWPKNCADGM
ncbi:MAG: hypothetical protein QXT68_00540 [Halobacteria archaeon]